MFFMVVWVAATTVGPSSRVEARLLLCNWSWSKPGWGKIRLLTPISSEVSAMSKPRLPTARLVCILATDPGKKRQKWSRKPFLALLETAPARLAFPLCFPPSALEARNCCGGRCRLLLIEGAFSGTCSSHWRPSLLGKPGLKGAEERGER